MDHHDQPRSRSATVVLFGKRDCWFYVCFLFFCAACVGGVYLQRLVVFLVKCCGRFVKFSSAASVAARKRL